MENREFINFLKEFDEFNIKTIELYEDSIPYYYNKFWTKKQRQGNSIHEISYRACFKPELPSFFIENLTDYGDKVLDPFMGRGTTILQSTLMGREAFGNDINPLSSLIVRPRFNPPSVDEINDFLHKVNWRKTGRIRKDLLAFFHPKVLRQISAMREWFLHEAPLCNQNPNPVIDWLRMICINRLTGHSEGFFSVYTLPPNQITSVENQLRINKKYNNTPPIRNIKSIILKKTKSLLRDGFTNSNNNFHLSTGLANNLKNIESNSISLIVTSPPFLDTVNYVRENWMSCWFAGIDAKNICMPTHRTERSWEEMVRSVLIEMARVLKPGGYIAFEVGEINKGEIFLDRTVRRAAINLPYKCICVVINTHDFTKTANCWSVLNNSRGTNTNRIVILRRSTE